MRIGFLQFPVHHGDVAANLDLIEDRLTDVGADLVVLPELCTTGYLFSSARGLAGIAEPLDGHTVERLKAITQRESVTVVAGIAERSGDRLYNTAVVVAGGELAGYQRKQHLTRLEAPLFAAGDDPTAFTVGGTTIGCVMCFDAWLPERPRMLADRGASILCCPSNFGGRDSLDVFRVRALENRVFVIVANRTGTETLDGLTADFRGDSTVYSPDGEVLVRASSDDEAAVVAVDLARAADKRSVMTDDLRREWSAYTIGTRHTH